VSLLGLVEVVPEDFWSRRGETGSWTAHEHLAHVATADELLIETLSGNTAEPYEARRSELFAAAREESVADLSARLHSERARLAGWLKHLPPTMLDRYIIAGVRDAWGQEVAWSVRGLLAAWSEHDTGHELAIRRAITTPPDASALSAAARRRR
jgi:hypothetical protein